MYNFEGANSFYEEACFHCRSSNGHKTQMSISSFFYHFLFFSKKRRKSSFFLSIVLTRFDTLSLQIIDLYQLKKQRKFFQKVQNFLQKNPKFFFPKVQNFVERSNFLFKKSKFSAKPISVSKNHILTYRQLIHGSNYHT